MARLIVFSKPFNVLSQFTDDQDGNSGRTFAGPSGRGSPDYDSEDWLLTDDGGLQQPLPILNTSVENHLVQVEGILDEEAIKTRSGCYPEGWTDLARKRPCALARP